MILTRLIKRELLTFLILAALIFNTKETANAFPVGSGSYTSSATDYFRSSANGNWTTISTWESSPDNTNWYPATSSPTSSANTITIQSSYVVTVTSSISLDQTIINGVLEIQNGGALSINNGISDDIKINNGGVLRTISTSTYGTQVIYAASANINILPGGKITIGDGTTTPGSGLDGFATDTRNIWNDGSVFEWNNTGAFTTNNAIYFPNASSAVKPVFRITKTSTAVIGSSNPTTIDGILEVNYSFLFGSSGAKIFRDGLIGTATLTLGGTGTLSITSSSAILGGTNLTLLINKTLNANAGLTTPAGSNVKIDDASSTGINVSGGNYTIASGALFDIGSNSTIAISSNIVIVNGVFKTSNVNGLSGAGGTSIPSGNVKLNNGSTVEYYASSNQKISIRNDYYNLVLSGGGTKTLAVNNSVTPINGTVTIPDNTTVDVGNNTFGSLSSPVSNGNPSNFTMLNGRFRCSGISTKPDMNGAYNLTGGVVEFYNNAATTQAINSKPYYNIEVTGNNVGNSNGNLEIINNGTFIVKTGGVFSISDEAIIGPSGTQTVIVENGGSFKTGDADGFSGGTGLSATSIRSDVENVTLMPGSTVEFNRSSSGSQFVTARNDYSNLTLSGVANKTFTGNCSVAGNFGVSGGFANSPATMNFIGTSGIQNIAGLFYNNLVFSGSAAKKFTSNGSLSGTLSMNGSNVSLDADGASDNLVFTLKSSSSFTARIDDLTNNNSTSGNSISGKITVERYIPAGRKWRFLSVPFSSSNQTINQAWQEGQTNLDIFSQVNNFIGYGTDITYDNNFAHGFDVNTTTNSSLKTWDSSAQAWTKTAPFTNSTNITSYPAYCIFIRGSRAVNLSQGVYANQDATTLRATGILKQGAVSQNFNALSNGDFVFVGNPYPSSVNMSNILLQNGGVINPNNFYVWDPKISGSYGVGSFVTYNTITGWSNTSGSYSAASPPVIQSGQAFFVIANTSGGNINFKENNKTAVEFNAFGKTINNAVVYIRLNVPSGGSLINVDGVAAGFGENYSAAIDNFDGRKIYNFNENLALCRDAQNLAVEVRPMPVFTDTLFFKMYGLKQQQYNLEILPYNIPENQKLVAYLVDKYLNIQTKINLTDTAFYNFSALADTSSYRNRFMLVFKRTLLATPVHIANILTANNVSNFILKEAEPTIKVFPNPARRGNGVAIEFNNMAKGKYVITVNSADGKLLKSQTVIHNSRNNIYNIKTSSGWPAGSFILKISNKKGIVSTGKLIITE